MCVCMIVYTCSAHPPPAPRGNWRGEAGMAEGGEGKEGEGEGSMLFISHFSSGDLFANMSRNNQLCLGIVKILFFVHQNH